MTETTATLGAALMPAPLPLLYPGVQSPPALPAEVTIACDSEFFGPHTLTVQAAARLDPDTLAVQVYRSTAIPELPASFDPRAFLPLGKDGYGRFCKKIVVRPVKLLTADLSPGRLFRDLY